MDDTYDDDLLFGPQPKYMGTVPGTRLRVSQTALQGRRHYRIADGVRSMRIAAEEVPALIEFLQGLNVGAASGVHPDQGTLDLRWS